MEKRNVLLLSQFPLPELTSKQLAEHQWIIMPANSLEEAEALISKHSIHIGLCCFDDDEKSYDIKHALLQLNTAHKIEWIGVFSKLCLQDTSFCRDIMSVIFDYHTLPVNPQHLLLGLGHAYGMATFAESNTLSELQPECYEDIVGSSPCMSSVIDKIRKFTNLDTPVLIQGENGSGRMLAAHTIHNHSARAPAPCIIVNCHTANEAVLKSQLCGGAEQDKFIPSAIEMADGGSLILNEVDKLPLSLQKVVLMLVNEQKFFRENCKTPITVNVRVISTTQQALSNEANSGLFLKELLLKLDALHLNMPSLREHKDDIEQLANYYFEKFSKQFPRNIQGFSKDAINVLTLHDWDGNISELINRIRNAFILCDGYWITPEDLDLERRKIPRNNQTLQEIRRSAEQTAIVAALERNNKNVTNAAKELSVSRVTLYRLLEKYKISYQKAVR